ncbi:MAG: hypothetical protein LBR57_02570 [Alistipes sp.]|jgi:hypothetical protein|nr:hypothetical protein [Alistipes sp.]
MAENITVSKLWLINALKKLSTAEFYRNLVAVIIGIIITFGGSNLIQKNAEQRETAYILSMVKDELRENLASVENTQKYLYRVYNDAVALLPYIDDPWSVPIDTIRVHNGIINKRSSFDYLTDAFEVLKSSSQIQYVHDKDLVRILIKLYREFETFQNAVGNHNTSGVQLTNTYQSNDMADAIIAASSKKDWRPIFAIAMRDNAVRNYIVNIANGHYGYLKSNDCDQLIAGITKTIEMIDKEIK